LFLRALAPYCETQARALAPALLAVGPVLPRIRAVMVGFIKLAAEQEKPRGCLTANTIDELCPAMRMPRRVWRVSWPMPRTGFLQGLRAAERQGRSPAHWTFRAGRAR
jgi:TetR/AcrR family transcriptional regulator, transcriptional repressor for nem operon